MPRDSSMNSSYMECAIAISGKQFLCSVVPTLDSVLTHFARRFSKEAISEWTSEVSVASTG